MKVRKPFVFRAAYWGVFILIVTQLLTFVVIMRENTFLEEQQIYVPSQPSEPVTIWPGTTTLPSGEVETKSAYSSLGPILIYFLAVVALLGIILFKIPLNALRIILRFVFVFLFCWGIFIFLIFWLPLPLTLLIAAGAGLSWYFSPRIWLHNTVLIIAMVSLGAVFGRLISPWTAMILLGAIAIYDFLAVRFGFMLWMANKLSESNTLPAFFLPHSFSDLNISLKHFSLNNIAGIPQVERQFSILGGGDVGFPVLLMSSVYFSSGFPSAVCIAISTALGLVLAYAIQSLFLKGRPVPAIPPIALTGLIGLLFVQFIL